MKENHLQQLKKYFFTYSNSFSLQQKIELNLHIGDQTWCRSRATHPKYNLPENITKDKTIRSNSDKFEQDNKKKQNERPTAYLLAYYILTINRYSDPITLFNYTQLLLNTNIFYFKILQVQYVLEILYLISNIKTKRA